MGRTMAGMSQSTSLDERLRLQRWIAAIGLTAAAEDAGRVDTAETNALALLGAHAACEALLGLLAGIRRYKQGDEYSFPRLLDDAARKVQLSPDLTDDLEAAHRVRNGFVHASNAVHTNEAARATASARRLMDVVSDQAFAAGHLPSGAGVATAVAGLIGIEAVGIWLRHADEMLAAGQIGLAGDSCARAMDAALQRTRPRLRQGKSLSRAASMRDLDRLSSGLGFDRHEREVAERIEGLQSWVVPLALGLPPARYRRIRDAVGSVMPMDMGGSPAPVHPPRTPTSEAEIRRTLASVSEVILRLWAMESLEARKGDDQIVQLAQPFLESPSRYAVEEESDPQ